VTKFSSGRSLLTDIFFTPQTEAKKPSPGRRGDDF
jgi:hypothetical protein